MFVRGSNILIIHSIKKKKAIHFIPFKLHNTDRQEVYDIEFRIKLERKNITLAEKKNDLISFHKKNALL